VSRRRRRGRGTSPRDLWDWLYGPQPIERLVLLRVLLPLAILGFMSSRLIHADYWLGDVGYSVPNLGGGDWRQPVYIAPLPVPLAWGLAGLLVVSGLASALGLFTRVSLSVFAQCLAYVALADRLSAFTVSKLAPVLVLALAFSAAGARYSLDALRTRARGQPPPTHTSGGVIRFFQLFLPVFYCASGVCKAQGEWLERWDVLWTHLHDTYQTAVTVGLANLLPGWSWSLFQGTTLAFEALAPLWFGLRQTRPLALVYGLGMHAFIGLMFGPVIWFSLLMMALLLSAYLPTRWLQHASQRLDARLRPATA
jgi:hypothetical protein